jgi:hypothetical protein
MFLLQQNHSCGLDTIEVAVQLLTSGHGISTSAMKRVPPKMSPG